TRHTPDMIADLSRRAYEYRIQVLRMVYGRKTGHLGGAFSAAEILTALYFHQLRLDPENPRWDDRDRLVFSKGHACAMLYTVMAHRGYFPVGELMTFRALDSRLQGHPEPAKTPGVEVPAGPLGHGVAIGAGMALGARLGWLAPPDLRGLGRWRAQFRRDLGRHDAGRQVRPGQLESHRGLQRGSADGNYGEGDADRADRGQVGRLQLARDGDSRAQHGGG